ncbi:MAG: hypothetical protein ACK57J_19715 [Rubrivivax sp.]
MNIGLGPSAEKPEGITLEQALGQVMRRFLSAYVEFVVDRGAEPTLIVAIYDSVSQEKVYALATALHQDCIAVVRTGVGGSLIGPRASAWGEFDLKQFIFPRVRVV